jgi:branched-chain amino acid aminotransferase
MLSIERPGADKVLAFYEHRVGLICNDPRLMLMPLDDHLVHRGDGIFESLKYVDRRMYLPEMHIKRMRRGAEAIGLVPPVSFGEIRSLIMDVAGASGEDSGMVRVLLGRGPGGFGIDSSECPEASLYIAAYRLKRVPEEDYEKGLRVCRVSVPAKQDWFAGIKSVNYLPNVLMTREARSKGCDMPVCFDENGFLAESAIANVALVDRRGTLIVPEFKHALAGTTQLRALDLIAGDPPIMQRSIREEEIFDAREFMIFGTTADCVSVVRYEGRPIHDGRPGPVAGRIRELLRRDLQENGEPF